MEAGQFWFGMRFGVELIVRLQRIVSGGWLHEIIVFFKTQSCCSFWKRTDYVVFSQGGADQSELVCVVILNSVSDCNLSSSYSLPHPKLLILKSSGLGLLRFFSTWDLPLRSFFLYVLFRIDFLSNICYYHGHICYYHGHIGYYHGDWGVRT